MPPKEPAPETWVLPNRMNFTEWIYHTFHPSHYKLDATGPVPSSPHQRLIGDLLNHRSPYRGLLLYHGLGVGKTRSSILTAEDFIRERKKIVVMLPASLQKNYRNEILMSSVVGRLKWKHWRRITLYPNAHPVDMGILLSLQEEFPIEDDFIKKYTQKASGRLEFWIPYIPEGLDIAASKQTPPQPWSAMTPKDQKVCQTIHEYFIDHTFQFINYNGLLKSHLTTKYKADFFEDKLVIMDEAHNFITQSMKEENIAAKLYQRLFHAKNVRLLLLSGTPLINRPVESAYLLNLLRGPIPTATFDFGKNPLPSPEDFQAFLQSTPFETTGVPLGNLVDTVVFSSDPKKKTVELTVFPFGFARTATGRHDIQRVEALPTTYEAYQRGFNEAFETHLSVLKSKSKWETHLAFPTDEKEFNNLFLKGDQMQHRSLYLQRCLGLVSYYQVNTTAFPEMLPMTVRRLPLTEHQFMTYLHHRHDEQKMERKKSLSTLRRGGVVEDEGNNVYRTFSRMTCNFVFPKTIKRQFPMSIRAALREMDDAHYHTVDDLEKKVEAKYERERYEALEALKRGGDAYLSEEALREHYSPKMASVLADLNTCPGKALFYSQFREMEGIGIFTLVLQNAGWRPIDIHLPEGSTHYEFTDPTVFQPQYNRKRYVVFNQDRVRSDILLKLFNGAGEWSLVPKEATRLVQTVQRNGFKDNLYGDLASLMMITQSGAEGISLKEVRHVYILEPFWNQVRIDQVIGRASRTNSHAKLPKHERNVQVFLYVSVFTPEQIEKDHTMRHLDNEKTSDEHILGIAQRKKHILEQFENAMKEASVDCLNHADNNRPREQGLRCYIAPVDFNDAHRDDVQLVPDLKEHLKWNARQQKRIERKTFQGTLDRRGRVQIPGKKQVFERAAYEKAGVLVAASSTQP